MTNRKRKWLHSSPGIYGKVTDISTGNIINKGRKVKKLSDGNSTGGGGHTPTPPTPTIKDYLCITALEDGCRVYFVMLFSQGSGTTHSIIEYSTDGINWQETESKDMIQEQDESGDSIIKFVAFTEINKGEHVYLKGLNKAYANLDSNIIQFFYCMPSSNEDIVLHEEEAHPLYDISGNIMSLIYGDDFENKTVLTEENKCCFAFMFSFYYLPNNYLNFVKNLKLSATVLSENCYAYMFAACSNITSAPELPATTLANNCYYYMFYYCASLATAPELPATILAEHCYDSMFMDCTSLTTASALPATTLTDYCYSCMFQDCTSLTTAPALSATTLADYCYSCMFEGCRALTIAPELPATTLTDYCYNNMFSGCRALTIAPELPATTLKHKCYNSMFGSCTSLTTAPALPATTLAEYCYDSMFVGCTSLATAPELPATILVSNCYRYMFQGCKSLTTAPALPATILTYQCYNGMFQDCTSLTTAPVLPATILVSNCYSWMFYGCTNLNYIKCLATNPSFTESYTSGWVKGVSQIGTFVKTKNVSGWTRGTNGIPSGWTVQDAPSAPDYVEIGGLKWAKWNVGATGETDYGLFFQWGDTSGYTASQVGSGSGQKYFGWADYKYGDGSQGESALTKYNSTDGLTALELSDDAVNAAYGGNWRMPTITEWQTLSSSVTTTWVTDYQGSGVSGLVCTANADNSTVLFFPAAGNCKDGSVDYVGSNAYCWGSTLVDVVSDRSSAHYINASNSGTVDWARYNFGFGRFYGFTVRGVLAE